MNEVALGTTFGILLGPHVLGVFDPRSWTGVTDILTREIMRVVLATGLFAIGVELPKRYMADHAKSLLIMVVPTMAFGWLVSAGKWASAITSRTHISSSSLLSTSIYPHPFPKTGFCILARDLGMLDSDRPDYQRSRYRFVTKIIENIGNLFRPSDRAGGAESASNDGLAYPFLSIALYLTTEASRETAFEKWIVIGWLCV